MKCHQFLVAKVDDSSTTMILPLVKVALRTVIIIIVVATAFVNENVDAFITTTTGTKVVHYYHLLYQQQQQGFMVSSSFDKRRRTSSTATTTTRATTVRKKLRLSTSTSLSSSIIDNNNSNDNDTTNNIKIKFGIHNIPGEDYQRPSKLNQDSYFMESIDIIEKGARRGSKLPIYCFGVLDGHGKDGHHLSNYFATNLPSKIQNQLLKEIRMVELEERIKEFAKFDDLLQNSNNNQNNNNNSHQYYYHQALINAFHEVHWNAMEDPTIKSGRSGSTCIACLLVPVVTTTDKEEEEEQKDYSCYYDLHVASVGDSRAIAITTTTTTTSNKDDDSSNNRETDSRQQEKDSKDYYEINVLAKEMTVSNNLTERDRIESCEDSTIRGNNVFYGPVGIAMTRALGDAIMIRAGVIPTPIVETFRFTRAKKSTNFIIILATDGIWDVLSNNDVADIIMMDQNDDDDGDDSQQQQPKLAAQRLANAAKQKWYGDLPINDEVKMDDITVMVIDLCK